MSENKKNVPKIRFPGFADAWEERKLGEIGETYTGLSGKSKKDFGHGEGKFVTYMNVFSNTIANPKMTEPVEIDNRQNEVRVGDVFFTTSSETPEEVGMSSVWLENSNNIYLNSFCFGYRPAEQFDNYFLAYMLRSSTTRKKIAFLAQGISRYNISKNKVIEITVSKPNIIEQERIGAFFKNLDCLITLHQRKLNNVRNLKVGLLQKMFPKDGEAFPEVRFPEFTDSWEQRRLVDNVEEVLDYRGKSPTKFGMEWGDEGYLVLSALNVKAGYIDKSVEAKYGDQELFERWMGECRLEKGDVLFTTEAPLGNVAQVPDDEGYILNQRAVAFKTDSSKTSNVFLAQLLRSPLVQAKLNANASGGTAKGIGMKEFAKLTAYVPTQVEEQEKIGSLFHNLDNLITLHQRKLNHLQEQKKALLQQMFV